MTLSFERYGHLRIDRIFGLGIYTNKGISLSDNVALSPSINVSSAITEAVLI